ncbi:MAG: hypothetical protein IPG77_11630 [Betaproteobacteria bacterium]|nr:hypothetical protein [Betaproteobacteria bacterium]
MTKQQTLALRLVVIEGLLPLATGDYAAALKRERDELAIQSVEMADDGAEPATAT